MTQYTGNRLLRPSLGLLLLGLTIGMQDSNARWDETYFPNFEVVSQHGERFAFYDDLIDGRIVVINFVYTSCPDICGLSTARLAWVRDALDDVSDDRVAFYSISLDPANDTPLKLKRYADAFGARDDWLFLTGDPEELQVIRWKLGERSRSLDEHRSDMVMGNDRTGFWRRISLMGNLRTVVREIRLLDPVFRSTARPPASRSIPQAAEARRALDDTPGQALFLKACAACHAIGGREQRVGPDLYGVTWRRERDWLMRAIMDPGGLRASGDTDMAALAARYPDVVMPDLSLSPDDARDVLLYLALRSGELAETRAEPHVHADGTVHFHKDDARNPDALSYTTDMPVHVAHEYHHGAEREAAGEPDNRVATGTAGSERATPTTKE